MNDYKELIAKFRAKKNDGWQKDGSYQEQIITVQDILDAADAIEQLVKERDAQIADCVPINELFKLRDWLYDSDGITMSGLKTINELLRKYSANELPMPQLRREDGRAEG